LCSFAEGNAYNINDLLLYEIMLLTDVGFRVTTAVKCSNKSKRYLLMLNGGVELAAVPVVVSVFSLLKSKAVSKI